MALEIRPLTGAIGAEIIGADVRDPAQFDAIFQAFTNHSVIAYIVVTSRRFLDRLAPADRDQLLRIVEEVTHERNRFAFQLDEINRLKVIEAGGKVKRLRPRQREAWVKTLKPVWGRFEAEIGPDLIRAAQGPRAEF